MARIVRCHHEGCSYGVDADVFPQLIRADGTYDCGHHGRCGAKDIHPRLCEILTPEMVDALDELGQHQQSTESIMLAGAAINAIREALGSPRDETINETFYRVNDQVRRVLPGVSGNYASLPETAELEITGEAVYRPFRLPDESQIMPKHWTTTLKCPTCKTVIRYEDEVPPWRESEALRNLCDEASLYLAEHETISGGYPIRASFSDPKAPEALVAEERERSWHRFQPVLEIRSATFCWVSHRVRDDIDLRCVECPVCLEEVFIENAIDPMSAPEAEPTVRTDRIDVGAVRTD